MIRAVLALVTVCLAYVVAALVYVGLGGSIENADSSDTTFFLVLVIIAWTIVGMIFRRWWVAAVPLVPYLAMKVADASNGGQYYSEDAVTLEGLLAVAIGSLLLGWLLVVGLESALARRET